MQLHKLQAQVVQLSSLQVCVMYRFKFRDVQIQIKDIREVQLESIHNHQQVSDCQGPRGARNYPKQTYGVRNLHLSVKYISTVSILSGNLLDVERLVGLGGSFYISSRATAFPRGHKYRSYATYPIINKHSSTFHAKYFGLLIMGRICESGTLEKIKTGGGL